MNELRKKAVENWHLIDQDNKKMLKIINPEVYGNLE